MSDDLVKSMEDDLRIGCSASIGDTKKAVATLKAKAAEITRLRAELATARREGMEEAAQIAAEFEIVAHLHGPWSDVPDECAVQASREIAAAIRAAAGEETKA